MSRQVVLIVMASAVFATAAHAADKAARPVVLIWGEGNLTITSTGTAIAGSGWATGVGQGTVSKHNQTMEMAQNLLQSCPNVEVTLDRAVVSDYYLLLNREGGAYNIGQSQIMALNRRKTVLFVAKKGTVKNAVKSACNAMMADWQTNGRLAIAEPGPTVAPVASDHAALTGAKGTTVAVSLQTTAAAQKRCKLQTIADVMNDTVTYLTAKGVAIGTAGNSAYTLTLIIDRPVSKWIQITMQARDEGDKLLWSETVSDGGWTHAGTTGTLNTLNRLHEIIDAKLGAQNGLPLAGKTN